MSPIQESLSRLGYTYQVEHRIWARAEPLSFDYSDGDETENRIYQIVAESADISVFSIDLQSSCTDWPTTYHLSSARGNLLRPIEHLLTGDTLEIGAGCGAITRFLGELGGNVIAVEGSERRAMIAAQRTRDLPNVAVVHDQFENFANGQQFDAITLIGVLEYAGKFSNSSDPVHSMLNTIRPLLKPGGVLIIAIENQLGLKYLAGALEDHLGAPRLGIQGLYERPGVETFGYQELKRKLGHAKFHNIESALPFPDYKLPASMILPAGYLQRSDFDVSALAAQVSSRDTQISSRQLNFSLECAWREVGKNNLLADLANSFLLVASTEAQGSRNFFKPTTLALHYSTQRQPALCKLAEFELNGEGKTQVEHRLINPGADVRSQTGNYRHRLPIETYFPGETQSTSILRKLQTPGWTAKELSLEISRYISIISRHMGLLAQDNLPVDLSQELPGSALDLIPQNIMVAGEQTQVIDFEWECASSVSLGYLVFRTLTTLIRMVSSFAVPKELRWLKQGRLFEDVYAHLGADFLQVDYEAYAALEADFMSFVSARPTPPIPFTDWHEHTLPSYLDTSYSTTHGLINQIQQLEELAERYIAQIRWLEGEKASLHEQVKHMDEVASKLQSNLDALLQENAALTQKKTDFEAIRVELGSLESEYERMKSELGQITEDFRHTQTDLEITRTELSTIKSGHLWKIRNYLKK